MSEQREQQEPKQCECGQSDFDGRVWSWRGVGTRRVCVANSTLSGYCPACGCRLSVVDGEPCVGEAYADLERDAKRFRAVEKAMGSPLDSPFNTHRWHFETDGMDMRYAALGEYADALGGETDGDDECCHSVPERGKHCIHCGARFTLLADGTVEVGPSQNRLLAGYRRAVEDLHNSWPQDECPMDFNHDCQFPADACCDSDGDCQRAARHEGRCCWLARWGLADTYADAQALWARMEEAAKSDE